MKLKEAEIIQLGRDLQSLKKIEEERDPRPRCREDLSPDKVPPFGQEITVQYYDDYQEEPVSFYVF